MEDPDTMGQNGGDSVLDNIDDIDGIDPDLAKALTRNYSELVKRF